MMGKQFGKRILSLSLELCQSRRGPLFESGVRSVGVYNGRGLFQTGGWRSTIPGWFPTAAASSFSTVAAEKQPTSIQPQMIQTEDGRQFAAFDMTITPKLKPYIVKRRLDRMRLYEGAEKNIRHSPWRMNLVCQFAAGLPLQEALLQLKFCQKSKAPLVEKVLRRTANLADIRDGLQHSQLEVAECFATKGTPLKRIKPMGRGRTGRMEHKHSHIRVVLREIDFKLRLYQAPTINQKKKWFLLQQEAEKDAKRVQEEREEIRRLEEEAKEREKKS